MNDGTKVTYDLLDKKGEKDGFIEKEYSSFQQTSDGFTALVHMKTYDKKDQLQTEGDYKILCNGNTVMVDVSSMIPEESMKAFENLEFELEMDEMEIPENLSEGQTLKDASAHLRSASVFPLKLDFDVTDRKVEGKESVTTPAGTFECYKITYNTKIKTIISAQYGGVDYITEKYGVIKTESYNKKGKLIGTTLLSKLEE
jgi:hypothetical protein